MENIKFTLQVVVLILAFPVWFITEMKKADKVLQNNLRHNMDTTNIRKLVVKHTKYEPTGSELVMIPFAGHMIETN